MISLSSLQILPPTDDKFFEEMVCDIFNSIEKTNSYDLFGRSGQKQFGIDIYSQERKTAIQCKHKLINASDKKIREELIKDLNYEFQQFLIYNKSLDNIYSKFIFATTFKNDTELVQRCLELSKEFNFKVEYWHWKRLTDKLEDSLLLKYSHQLVSENINYYRDDQLKVSEIEIDTTIPFIDQIEQYFKTLFDEVKILHANFFLNQYPFKTGDDTTYRVNFTIDSDNEALTMFFDSFNINDGLIEMKNHNKKEKLKVEFILRTLNSNNVFYFRNKNKGFLKNIEYDTSITDTYYIKYDQFKFVEGLNSVPKLTKNASVSDFMQLGYFYYKCDVEKPVKLTTTFQCKLITSSGAN
ncbi:hypothetical protein [Flavobacterium daemonense]|uniref:hypothetical protein n=1 Tax=Flavobacterium daemonense TaxID=1393049 RepID=UPI0011857E63|nr:hypothetical protein [Flavobacterium daemonense]KAF2334491.1 hypothetical protein FND99_09335 [Flavobacterium daemonense]